MRIVPSLRARLAQGMAHPVVDVAVMALIAASVGLLFAEETMALAPGHWVVLAGEVITWVFAVELSLRFLVAKKKLRFFRRYWPDLLALLPLLRPLRVFTFLRLFRLFRLFQLGLLLDRRVSILRGMFQVNFYFLWVLVVLTFIFILGGGVMAFLFEHRLGNGFASLQETLWWAAYTVIAGEPIGATPTSASGRVVLALLMLGGMVLFAIFTGLVSATMIERLQNLSRVGEMDIDELEGHIVICGWNAGVKPLLGELAVDEALRGVPVVCLNELERLPDLSDVGIRTDLVYHVCGEFTQLGFLKKTGVERAARAVVMADDTRNHAYGDRDARAVLAALTIERLNPKIYCVVELINAANVDHLKVAGVEAVVMRSDLMGRAVASACRHPILMQVMMNLMTQRHSETMLRIPAPSTPQPFGDLIQEFKRKQNILVIGLESGGKTSINPAFDRLVNPEDFLVVIVGGAA